MEGEGGGGETGEREERCNRYTGEESTEDTGEESTEDTGEEETEEHEWESTVLETKKDHHIILMQTYRQFSLNFL